MPVITISHHGPLTTYPHTTPFLYITTHATPQTAREVCCESFKDVPQLGRLTLRDEGKTIAIGKITRVLPTAPK